MFGFPRNHRGSLCKQGRGTPGGRRTAFTGAASHPNPQLSLGPGSSPGSSFAGGRNHHLQNLSRLRAPPGTHLSPGCLRPQPPLGVSWSPANVPAQPQPGAGGQDGTGASDCSDPKLASGQAAVKVETSKQSKLLPSKEKCWRTNQKK